MLTLTGTPVNVIVSDYAAELPAPGSGSSSSPSPASRCVIGSIAVVVARRAAAPARKRKPKALPADLSRHARTLVDQYGLDASAGPRRRAASLLDRDVRPRRGDDPAALVAHRRGRVPGHGHRGRRPRRARGPAPGRGAGPGRDRRSGRATRSCSRAAGSRSRSTLGDPRVLAVDAPDLVRRQAVPLGPGAGRAIAILAGMIVAARDRDRARRPWPGCWRRARWSCCRVVTPEARLPRHLVDDGRPGRRHDPAVDGDDPDRRRGADRRPARRDRRRRSGRTRCWPGCSSSPRCSASSSATWRPR